MRLHRPGRLLLAPLPAAVQPAGRQRLPGPHCLHTQQAGQRGTVQKHAADVGWQLLYANRRRAGGSCRRKRQLRCPAIPGLLQWRGAADGRHVSGSARRHSRCWRLLPHLPREGNLQRLDLLRRARWLQVSASEGRAYTHCGWAACAASHALCCPLHRHCLALDWPWPCSYTHDSRTFQLAGGQCECCYHRSAVRCKVPSHCPASFATLARCCRPPDRHCCSQPNGAGELRFNDVSTPIIGEQLCCLPWFALALPAVLRSQPAPATTPACLADCFIVAHALRLVGSNFINAALLCVSRVPAGGAVKGRGCSVLWRRPAQHHGTAAAAQRLCCPAGRDPERWWAAALCRFSQVRNYQTPAIIAASAACAMQQQLTIAVCPCCGCRPEIGECVLAGSTQELASACQSTPNCSAVVSLQREQLHAAQLQRGCVLTT